MAMDLYGDGGILRWSFKGWRVVLSVAIRYGWRPMGTEPPDWDRDGVGDEQIAAENAETAAAWDGNYLSNNFQTVNALDARNLADALQSALSDFPDNRQVLVRFIAYCRAGAFRIG
jgi:hypothetical protein